MGADRRNGAEKELEERLESFFACFAPTLQLADEFIASRSHAQELLVLLCSRLDALASSAVREDTPRREAFIRFVTSYGRHRALFESVSMGDLYFDLARHRAFLELLIEKPGRIRRYSRDDDPMVEFLWASGVALTAHDAERLLGRIMRALRQGFRVAPGQRKRKPLRAKPAQAVEAIVAAFRSPRAGETKDAMPKALTPLLRANTLAAILYDSYRCEAIHSGEVDLDERKFFRQQSPYWIAGESEYFDPYLYVQFPARFLARLLHDCIKTYRHHLLSRRKLPARVFFRIFEEEAYSNLDMLDEDTVEEGHLLRPTRSFG